ncbi:MAG TPA: efflux RND transporter periplasmic adaptor subunit [Chlamydiales bacterium]|nr:efflux RND transporter periplasmic adaptor subunit [Chlamydiales bacterium]
MHRLTITICLLLCLSCSGKKQSPPPTVSVKAVKTIKKDVPLYLDAVGHVDPLLKVNITSRVRGELIGVYFNQGDLVKENELLFTIDPRTYQANFDAAEAALDATASRLKIAREKVARFTNLTKEEYFSQLDFDQLNADVETLEAQYNENKAMVDSASINLDYCWIYSPIEGRTGILQLDPGNLVKDDETQVLITVNQMKPIFVTFSIPERELPKIQYYLGQNDIETLVYFEEPAITCTGYIEMIDNMVDKNTGMVKIRSLFANNEEALWPGEFVRTRLILTTLKNSLIIPYEAIDITTKGTFVYVIKADNTVDLREVKLGPRENDHVVITSGLEEGEKVVTEGQLNLTPGTSVEIKE